MVLLFSGGGMARASLLDLNPFDKTISFTFVLLENFSLMPLSSAIDTLRNANRIIGHDLYQWNIAAESLDIVQCSSNIALNVDIKLTDIPSDSIIIICGGIDSNNKITGSMQEWLCQSSRLSDRPIGALCLGAYALASSGLLDGYSCSIHWEDIASFQENYPNVQVKNSLFEIDRDRFTCSGGTAATDMMLSMIAAHHSEEIASQVAEAVIHSTIRHSSQSQRMDLHTRVGIRHTKLLLIIERMENNLEKPISPNTLAEEAQISTRQLERLFRRYLNKSPKRYYLELRLKHARKLLLQTSMPLIDIAISCGFSSTSHFSKSYRTFFETTPYRERGMQNMLYMK